MLEGYLPSQFLFNVDLETAQHFNKQNVKNGIEEIQLLFTHDITIFIENPKESINKLLELKCDLLDTRSI